MRLHVLGLPHTETTKKWSACAYTQRTMDFASMMTLRGYDVRLYAGEQNEAGVTEHVTVATREDQARWFPGFEPSRMFNEFDSASAPWVEFNARCAAAIRERAEPGDVLCITMGLSQKPVADQLADRGLLQVETGIGYSGVWAPYRVFESAAWRHYMAAKEPTDNLRWFDAVVPRGYFLGDFPIGPGGNDYLFMGRLIARKGPQIAAETCQRLGARLLVAGQGVDKIEPGRLTSTDGTVLEGDVHYVGVLTPEQRAILLGSVRAVFMPTFYLEPGGGVAIEAQLTGTPVITTPWGAMTETVAEGLSGFHCSTLNEFVHAAEGVGDLCRAEISQRAHALYSAKTVSLQYQRYFDRLSTLYRDGWYQL